MSMKIHVNYYCLNTTLRMLSPYLTKHCYILNGKMSQHVATFL